MAIKLIVSSEDKALLTEALTKLATPIMQKPKQNRDEKRLLVQVENLIMQINFGKEIP
jgi:hypothetical protein